MFTKTHLADLTHLDSLVDNPLGSIAIPYVEALNAQHYARYTIERYVNCVIHFGYWLNAEGVELQSINQAVIHRYLHDLLLVCSASAISSDSIKMDRAALKHLLTFLPQQYSVITKSPIEAELERFTDYLLNICGMSPQTCVNRCQHVGAFLSHRFCSEAPVIAQITGADIDAFFSTHGFEMATSITGSRLRQFAQLLTLLCFTGRTHHRFVSLYSKGCILVTCNLAQGAIRHTSRCISKGIRLYVRGRYARLCHRPLLAGYWVTRS